MTITFFMNTNIDRTVILNLKTMENVGDIGLWQKYHNTLYGPSKILLKNVFFNFSWDLRQSPQEKLKTMLLEGQQRVLSLYFEKGLFILGDLRYIIICEN